MTKLQDYALFFSKPVVFGLASFALFWLFINPYNEIFKSGEIAINTYSLNIFVGWIFFSAFLLLRADEEWKKTDEAVRTGDFKKFKAEAPKKIAASVKITYLSISALAVISYYLFHFESELLAFITVFGMSFLIMLTKMVLWDLDDPASGLIVIHNIPKDWLKKISD
ncbi:hypothetical protein HYS54_03440 [Candidatus Micrarchaeota archaeon]|nr:hypothetical protein [Candidatus Micrarchaeota archaeon]